MLVGTRNAEKASAVRRCEPPVSDHMELGFKPSYLTPHLHSLCFQLELALFRGVKPTYS